MQSMYMSARDLSILRLVAAFSQLTATHVADCLFDNASRTPINRAILRMIDKQLLARVELRVVGGARGGSGQYVYELGKEGRRMMGGGRWSPGRSVNFHALAIADCYATLKRMERAGRLTVAEYITEPDTYTTIGGHYLKPDLYVHLQRGDRSIHLWFEVDMASQNRAQIAGKLARYTGAYEAATPQQWSENHLVVFAAIDDVRAAQLKRMVGELEPGQQALFRVVTIARLADALG